MAEADISATEPQTVGFKPRGLKFVNSLNRLPAAPDTLIEVPRSIDPDHPVSIPEFASAS
jgi:hypothetical protein